MATVIHHHVTTSETPTGLYWAVGAMAVVLLLGLVFYFSSTTSTTELAMPVLPPVVPFIPLM